MRPTRAIHRGQLGTFRVGTKDQLAVMADKTKPFQAAPMDSLHNLLYWAAQHEGHNVSSEVCSHCKIAFNDAVECFIHCCLNSSGFSEYCKKWKFESHWSGAHFADLWANKKNCRKTLNWCPVAQCIYPYLLLLAKINLRPLQGTNISLPPTHQDAKLLCNGLELHRKLEIGNCKLALCKLGNCELSIDCKL